MIAIIATITTVVQACSNVATGCASTPLSVTGSGFQEAVTGTDILAMADPDDIRIARKPSGNHRLTIVQEIAEKTNTDDEK